MMNVLPFHHNNSKSNKPQRITSRFLIYYCLFLVHWNTIIYPTTRMCNCRYFVQSFSTTTTFKRASSSFVPSSLFKIQTRRTILTTTSTSTSAFIIPSNSNIHQCRVTQLTQQQCQRRKQQQQLQQLVNYGDYGFQFVSSPVSCLFSTTTKLSSSDDTNNNNNDNDSNNTNNDSKDFFVKSKISPLEIINNNDDNPSHDDNDTTSSTTTTSTTSTTSNPNFNTINIQQQNTNNNSNIVDDDTIAINSVGQAVTQKQGYQFDFSSATSDSLLAIDPSSIEIIPYSLALKEHSSDLNYKVMNLEDDDVLEDEEEEDDDDNYNGTTITTTTSSSSSSSTDDSNNNGPSSKLYSRKTDQYVNMFRGSANYIANHRNTIVVYHIPGELLDWKGFADLMDDIALTWLLGMKPVIVIGCRKQINDKILQSSSSSNVDDDYGNATTNGTSNEDDNQDEPKGMQSYKTVRITDYQTLRIVKEEAGFVRFEVERQLGRALRRHGTIAHEACEDGNIVSGNFYSAQPYGVIDGIDFQFTGFPRRVEVEKIKQVLAANDIVLLTPLGASPSGELFNVNSENLAGTVAASLGASKLVFFAVEGTAFRDKRNQKLLQNLRVSDAKNLLKFSKVNVNASKGFAHVEDSNRYTSAKLEALLKIGWATLALEKGVKRAHIIPPTNGALLQELYTRDGAGTLISRDLYEGIRPANYNDVSGIFELVDPLVRAGTLVPRPKTVLEKDINSYFVYTRDKLIVAVAQLKLFEMGFAEIGCMVVSREYRSQGRGDAMLGYLERLSVHCGCTSVFVLSTQTMDFFAERGFKEVSVDTLPPSRKAVYNYERKSKIFMKKIEDARDLDAAELWWNR